jgi:hypothetical protein
LITSLSDIHYEISRLAIERLECLREVFEDSHDGRKTFLKVKRSALLKVDLCELQCSLALADLSQFIDLVAKCLGQSRGGS